MRKVIVVGAGLAGVTTAYELVCRGHNTLLVDRREGVALESSFANGSLLTPSMADPWNTPGVHRQLVASLFDPHSAMKLRPAALPSLVSWGVRFLRHSSVLRHAAATRANFLLAQYSLECMRELTARLALAYDAARVGTLKVFRTLQAMERPRALATMLAPLGLRAQVLDADAAVAVEPELAAIRQQIAGAMRFPDDESGDARLFCEQLTDAFRRAGGTARYNSGVTEILVEGSVVRGVRLGETFEHADMVVVAAGNTSVSLVRRLGMSLPIRPAKGYTLTFDLSNIACPPKVPIVDESLHAAVVPIGSRLRVAGTAEFAGHNLRLRRERVENLRKLLAAVYPRLAGLLPPHSAQAWCGLRPMSADGLPFVGPAPVPGLFLNTGHGHLGWTLAAGSARLLVDLIEGKSPQIAAEPYRATR